MRLFIILLCSILFIIIDPQDSSKDNSHSNNFSQKSQDLLNGFKRKTKVQGLAFAIFNKNETLFSDCLGKSTYGFKIDDKTLFSIQSISKNITALAIVVLKITRNKKRL